MMHNNDLLSLFDELYHQKITPEKAAGRFKFLPYEDLGFAKADTHRHFRTGLSEVIFCEGKTGRQVVEIGKKLFKAHGYFVATRVSPEIGVALKKTFKSIQYSSESRVAIHGKLPVKTLKRGIAIMTAGTADIPVAEEAAVIAKLMGQDVEKIYDVGVAGLHRMLDQRETIEKCNILIVIAGMEGALPSIVAGIFGKPIIAVPTSIGYGANFKGVSALLTMLNSCALGISVVNIDNGFGAGYLAARLNERCS